MAKESNQNRGCLVGLISLLLGKAGKKDSLPYALRDDFLSPAEVSFYHVLRSALGEDLRICPKVGLNDLFFVRRPKENQGYSNRINRKHIDFVLCDARTMRPMLGIELDDSSHARGDRQERDAFVDEVFGAAGLPLVRISVRRAYTAQEIRAAVERAIGAQSSRRQTEQRQTPAVSSASVMPGPVGTAPACPKCGLPMIPKTATRGEKTGSVFYGCPNYPKCRETLPFT